ncbi:MAG TPA: lysophospholipid acyltransferase family protein [Rectinemataceae bacterium]|nr:lysophospholipid acyltransferase family protein [Rectinemataceae bacterium]
MISARRYRPTNTRFFTWLLRGTAGALMARAYNAHAVGLDVFEAVKPPFILVGNHSCNMDPILTNYFVPHPIHWVASDGNLRSPLMRFLLIKLVGAIPKSKSIPDIETVNWIVEFIRKKKGVVGFYPEGQATWDGTSLPSLESTAKLVKLLKAPVVCAISGGAFMTKPRWSYARRSGEMEIGYTLLLSPERIKELSVAEIDRVLNEAIYHDDQAWARKRGLRFASPKRAERLELALYACPVCGRLQTMKSNGCVVSCAACGFAADYGEDGSFRLAKAGERGPPACRTMGSNSEGLLFASLREWDTWQRSHLKTLLATDFAPVPGRSIFADEKVRLLRGKRMDSMESLGYGRLTLSSDSLTLWPEKGEAISFDIAEIEKPGVLKWNFFEFYVGKMVYRARFDDRTASGYKYATAAELLIALRAKRD